MGKQYLNDSVAPGVVLNPAVGEGLSLYEPGIAPAMGVDIAAATAPGISIDKSFDEVQAMANPGWFDRPENWGDYLAVGAGLLGSQPKKQAPKAPEWKPQSLPPVQVMPTYMQGPVNLTLMEEIMRRNGPMTYRLNIPKGGAA